MTRIEIESPEESNWPWIMEKHAETAWASLSPDLRSAVTVQDMREGLAEQTANLRAEHGENNQVFIAREADGQLAGYIWVGRNKSGFTGVVQAHILNFFVEEEFRGQGIGVLLMSRAEDWAREHQLKRIGLSFPCPTQPQLDCMKNWLMKPRPCAWSRTLSRTDCEKGRLE